MTILPLRRTQAERRDESEARLLEAAARLIEAEGFGAVTFERVGAAAGYSRGLAAHKFGSKDGLVRAVIGYVQQRLSSRVEAAMAGANSDATSQILTWSDAMLREVERDPLIRAYFVMMAAAVGDRAPIRPAFLAAHEEVRIGLRALIEAGQAAGALPRALPADAIALSIGSLHLGIATELLLDPDLDMAAMRAVARRAIGGMLG